MKRKKKKRKEKKRKEKRRKEKKKSGGKNRVKKGHQIKQQRKPMMTPIQSRK